MRHKSTELMGSIKAFVDDYYKEYRHSPSTTQIADAVGIARGTAYKYLVAMSDNVMIRYDGQQISTEQTEKVQTEFTSKERLTHIFEKQVDALPYAKDGTLQHKIDEIFGE